MDEELLNEFRKNQIQLRIWDRQDDGLVELLDVIPFNTRRVLELRYGLADGHQYSVEETADIFAQSVNWVVEIESRALLQLYYLYCGSMAYVGAYAWVPIRRSSFGWEP